MLHWAHHAQTSESHSLGELTLNRMEHRVWLLTLALFSLSAHGQTESSNLNNIDVDEPIVRYSPSLDDADRDLFGYAVVLHQLEELEPSDDVETALGKTL